jgi:hypothetical protein
MLSAGFHLSNPSARNVQNFRIGENQTDHSVGQAEADLNTAAKEAPGLIFAKHFARGGA